MKTKTTKKVETERKELKPLFALWTKQSKEGNVYYTGKTEDDVRLIAFVNSNKKNPKEPDVRVYVNEKQEDGSYKMSNEEVASLWSNVSDNGKRYLSGSTNENEKVVGFYGELTEETKPYIRVYLQEKE